MHLELRPPYPIKNAARRCFYLFRSGLILSISFIAYEVSLCSTVSAAGSDLDIIVVTAERREEPLLGATQSISRIEGEDIRSISIDHPSDLFNRAAGVNIHRNNGQEHLTAIRSPVLTAGAGAGSFLYLEDGIPLRAAGFANVNGLFESGFNFAGAAEVVKGPGSVLYGSNAVHGLINVVSRPASPDFSGFADFSVGPHELVKGSGSVSGGVGSGALRASLHLAHDGGYRDSSGYDEQKIQIRYDREYGNWDIAGSISYQNLNQETAGFVQGPDAYRDRTLSMQNANPEAFRDAKSVRAYLRLDRALSGESHISVTPYVRWTDMEFLMHFLPGQPVENNGHQSIGLLTTYYAGAGPVRGVVGLDMEASHGFLSEVQSGPTVFSFVTGTHYDYEVNTYVISPYGQIEWDVTDKLTLEAGARLDYSKFSYDNLTSDGIVGRFLRVSDANDDFVTITPKLSASYALADKLSLYGRYARGARAPQTTDLYRLQRNQMPGDADPETLDAVEVGVRSYRGPIRFHLATFAMWKRNFFFRDSDGFNVSDGQTRHVGVELEGQADITKNLSATMNLTYARHSYTFDGPADGIVRGNDVDTAPRFFFNARLKYQPVDAFSVELEWRHMGTYFTEPSNQFDYPGHDVLALRAEAKINKNVSGFAQVNNLTNARYAERADFAFGNERYFPGEKRAIFVGLRSSF